jgi:hypothetical protein
MDRVLPLLRTLLRLQLRITNDLTQPLYDRSGESRYCLVTDTGSPYDPVLLVATACLPMAIALGCSAIRWLSSWTRGKKHSLLLVLFAYAAVLAHAIAAIFVGLYSLHPGACMHWGSRLFVFLFCAMVCHDLGRTYLAASPKLGSELAHLIGSAFVHAHTH